MAVTYTSVLTALYDYTPDSSDDEVAIKEEQLLLLLDGSDDEWVLALYMRFKAE
jgi:hypothetical protein